MTYLIPFIILDLINPWGLDSFVLPKAWTLSLLVVWWESSRETDLVESLLIFCCVSMVLVLSFDWCTSVLGCELMGFGGLVQIFLYCEVFRMSKGTDPAPAILAFVVPVCLYAVLQRLGIDYAHHTWTIPHGRAISTQGNPVFLSIVIGMIFPLAVNSKQKGWAWSSLLAIIVGGLWAANSKSGILAATVGTLCYFI